MLAIKIYQHNTKAISYFGFKRVKHVVEFQRFFRVFIVALFYILSSLFALYQEKLLVRF